MRGGTSTEGGVAELKLRGEKQMPQLVGSPSKERNGQGERTLTEKCWGHGS